MANDMLQLVHALIYGNGIHIGQLNGNSRFLATMMGNHADYIPFMGPQIHDHAMTVAKLPARKYYWDAELLVNTQVAVERWYGFDTITIVADAYNFEVEALGAKFIYSDFAMPTVDLRDPLIKQPSDLKKLGDLDPTKGRIPIGVEMARLIQQKAMKLLAGGFFCSPFSFLCQAMGYPAVIRAITRDKAYANDLFDFAENHAILPYLRAMNAIGVKSAFGADAWSCFPNLTPELFVEWVIPSAERLIKKAKEEMKFKAQPAQAGLDYDEEDPAKMDKQILFKCMDVANKLSILKSLSIVMGRTQDIDPHWMQEYAVSRGKGSKKIPIIASLNGRFVRDSSPAQIVALIKKWIDIMGRDGRLMVFIGNVPADCPPINVHTAVSATHTLGVYPIVSDLKKIEVKTPQFQPFDEWLKGQPEEDIIRRARK
jgi:hypothetical protein